MYLTNANLGRTNLQEPNLEKVNLTKADIKRVLLDGYKARRKECRENIPEKK